MMLIMYTARVRCVCLFQVRDMEAQLQELQEDIDAEKTARQRSDMKRSQVTEELDKLRAELDERTGSSQANAELRQKREAELAELRKNVDEEKQSHDRNLAVRSRSDHIPQSNLLTVFTCLEKLKFTYCTIHLVHFY